MLLQDTKKNTLSLSKTEFKCDSDQDPALSSQARLQKAHAD